MLSKLKTIPTRHVLIGIVLAVSAVLITMTINGHKAKAADKGAPVAKAAVVEVDPDASLWTGFGVGLRAGVGEGGASAGGPVGVDISGQMAGAFVFYRHQLGPIVLGADCGYDRVWGDLHTFGIDYLLNCGGSIGVLPSKNAMLYTRMEGLRAVGSGGHINGWGLGGGAEMKVAASPISFGIEYMHDWMDKSAFGPSVDVRGDRIMFVGKWQFGGGSRPNLFADR